jgi:ankyrin repeat protein
MLVDAGADPNTLNNWGFSPLLVALIKKHMRCVRKMTDIPSIDVNIRDNMGRGFLFGVVF